MSEKLLYRKFDYEFTQLKEWMEKEVEDPSNLKEDMVKYYLWSTGFIYSFRNHEDL